MFRKRQEIRPRRSRCRNAFVDRNRRCDRRGRGNPSGERSRAAVLAVPFHRAPAPPTRSMNLWIRPRP